MNTAFRFDRSHAGVQQNKYNFEYWKTVTDLYDKKQYKESVLALIKYIDESLITKCATVIKQNSTSHTDQPLST